MSFLSPCVLPLVPGYLSTVIGVTPTDLREGVGARRVLVPSLLFIASFSSIFILLGLSATVIGSTLNAHKHALEQVGGVVIILLGVVFLATPFVNLLNREWHSESLLRVAGRGGPLVAGAAFAIAWTPCTSITLGAILTQAAVSSSAAHGALLLAVYSAGLAIPFLLIALAFRADDHGARDRQASLPRDHRVRRRGDDHARRADPRRASSPCSTLGHRAPRRGRGAFSAKRPRLPRAPGPARAPR